MEAQKRPANVPYINFEGEMARQERHVKRLWIALLVAIAALALTVGIFVWYLNQYDFISYDYQQDGEGVNIIGDGNGVDYNEPARESANQNEEEPLDSEG